jgi:hypothetical protein
MSIDAPPTKMDTNDLEQAIARLVSGVRDPVVGQRAREEMDRMREETRKRIDTVEVAVELIRDARNQ